MSWGPPRPQGVVLEDSKLNYVHIASKDIAERW
ncbi:protein of unknown function [Thiomonas sp. Sup16B3]|nr:protein of unknown function [Thiomonas sp. Sup16B3]